MKLSVPNNPRATPAQVLRLAKKDLGAALKHPNAPLELLLEHGAHLDTITKNPAWELWQLSEPEKTTSFICNTRESRAKAEIDKICGELPKSDRGRRYLVAWAAECYRVASPVWRRDYPDDKRPAQAIRAALRWAVGLRPGGVENRDTAYAAAANAANAATAAYAAANAANAAYAAANAAYAAANAAYAAADAANAAYAAANAAYAAVYAVYAAYAANDPLARAALRERQLARLLDYSQGRVAWLEAAFLRFGVGKNFHPSEAQGEYECLKNQNPSEAGSALTTPAGDL